MERLKKIGVVIPCHNYGDYVCNAIESAIEQTYEGDISVIVIDDGSSDNTIKNIKQEFARFPNDEIDENETEFSYSNYMGLHDTTYRSLNVFRLPEPTGPSNARNVGLEKLFNLYPEVEVVAFLDADDIMLPNKVSTLLPIFDDPAVGSVYADYYHLYDDDTYVIELKEIFDRERFVIENIGPNNTSLVSKNALMTVKEDYGFFDPTLRTCEDYDLFLRISEKFPIKHIAEPLTYVRVHGNNSTTTVNKKIWEMNRRKVTQKMVERMNAKQQINTL